MIEKEVVYPLSKALELPEGKDVNKTYISIIMEEEIPVLCVNRDAGKKRLMPFKVLFDNNNNFWHQEGRWKYYFTAESMKKIKEKAVVKKAIWEMEKQKKQAKPVQTEEPEVLEELKEIDVGYGKEYNTFAKMTHIEKIDCLNKNKSRLNELLALKQRDAAVVTETLVDTTKDAALINHTALEETLRLADDEAKKFTQDLVDSTNEMVKSSAQLISLEIFNNELMSRMVEKSNGTIVQHMTRVYLNGISFLSYYNHLVSSTSAIQKIRISFASKYCNFYGSLLPHIDSDDFDLERVFLGGMRAISVDQYFKWAVGFLLHDIGKASAVEYHEGESSYNRDIVIDHVKQGYKSIMNKTNYPMEASLITGYHHEYYGDSTGYGYFRAYLQQYKRLNPSAKVDYCITYELEPMLDYHALAYFPAKVLEIVDVFDSLTDPHRIYRKVMEPEEALAMMREEFIEKHQKLDVILFDIFDTFIREKERQKQLKNK